MTDSPQPTRVTVPPGPRGLPIVGSLLALMRDPLSLVARCVRDFGDVALLSRWPFKTYLLNHPDHVRDLVVANHRDVHQGPMQQSMKLGLGEGLISSEGEFHLRQRRLIQPTFHKERISIYAKVMIDYALKHTSRWQDSDLVNIDDEMMELTLRIVVKSLFNAEVPSQVKEIGDAIDVMRRYMVSRGRNPLGRFLHKLPLPSTRRFLRHKAIIDGIIYGYIDQRDGSGDGADLLSMLLLANDPETNNARMSRAQVRDEAISLAAAGHETTAVALTWTFYLLSKHPEVETKLHAELDSVLGNRPPTVLDLPDLPYTEQVVTESMRLYPPIWVTARIVDNDLTIGGYVIPKGSVAFVSQFAVHRDPRWFTNPLVFQPERWTPQFKASLPRYAYFPFGAGPRQCIGEPFAWLEEILVLATIAQRWRLRIAPGYSERLTGSISLRPKRGMPMTVHRRSSPSLPG